MQLLRLSLPGHADPLKLLEEATGNQRYILDYLIEEVLRRQPQEVQTFLLCTSILEHLTASLCDAVMQQHGSQQMLERLEQANLFVVSLDSKRQWYRYQTLFAQALCYQLEQTQSDLLPSLHQRYAQHEQPTQAILHALRAKEWSWAADLIERQNTALRIHTWGIRKQKVLLLRDWLERRPSSSANRLNPPSRSLFHIRGTPCCYVSVCRVESWKKLALPYRRLNASAAV